MPSDRTVLLTGATGLLGSWICRHLLQQPHTELVCLVRAPDQHDATQRLRRALAAVGAPAPDRARALPGALDAPRLGLSSQQWNALNRRLDAVYHAGALIDLSAPYTRLHAANVLGTRQVLDLAADTGAPVHHVSTAGVHLARTDLDEADEGTPLPPAASAGHPYIRSKIAAEELVHAARMRGQTVTVHRPALVLRAAAETTAAADNPVALTVQVSLTIGCLPRSYTEILAARADDTAQAVVTLAETAPAATGQTFHPFAQPPLRWQDLALHLIRDGSPLPTVPFDDWLEQARQHRDQPCVRRLLATLPAIRHLLVPPRPIPRIHADHTHRLLQRLGNPMPALTPALLLDEITRARTTLASAAP